jgi:hypothetical protein
MLVRLEVCYPLPGPTRFGMRFLHRLFSTVNLFYQVVFFLLRTGDSRHPFASLTLVALGEEVLRALELGANTELLHVCRFCVSPLFLAVCAPRSRGVPFRCNGCERLGLAIFAGRGYCAAVGSARQWRKSSRASRPHRDTRTADRCASIRCSALQAPTCSMQSH